MYSYIRDVNDRADVLHNYTNLGLALAFNNMIYVSFANSVVYYIISLNLFRNNADKNCFQLTTYCKDNNPSCKYIYINEYYMSFGLATSDSAQQKISYSYILWTV